MAALADGLDPSALAADLSLPGEAIQRALGALELGGFVRPSLCGLVLTPAGERELTPRGED